MLKIKLFPKGKKHQRTFRIVVAESRSKSNGKFVDDLGFFIPQLKSLQVNKDLISQWQKKGAQLTVGVDKLLNPSKYPKKTKTKKTKSTSPKVNTPEKAE